MAALAIAGGMQIASSILGATSGYYGSKIQKYQAETNAKLAEMQGKADGLSLASSYNKTQATNAVVSAAQNRRGGSVTAISDAAESGYEFDLQMVELGAYMQTSGYETNAQMAKLSGKQSIFSGLLGAAQTASNIYSIGGSTKTSTIKPDKYYSSIGTNSYFAKGS